MHDDQGPLRVLFVCSQNKWRSRTAEHQFRNRQDLAVRSAGTARGARVRLSAKLVEWAEVILVMEDHHKRRLREQFRDQLPGRDVHVLHIPDQYEYGHPVLIQLLEEAVEDLFGASEEDEHP